MSTAPMLEIGLLVAIAVNVGAAAYNIWQIFRSARLAREQLDAFDSLMRKLKDACP